MSNQTSNQLMDNLKTFLRKAASTPALAIQASIGYSFVAVILAAMFGWQVLVLAALIYVACAAFVVSDRGSGVTPAAAPRPTLAVGPRYDLTKLEGKYRGCVEQAMQRQQSINRAISDTPDQGLRHALEDATKDLPELIDTVYGLAMKAGSVQTAIQSSSSMENLADDIKRLEASIKGTTDEFQRSQYYAALDGKLQQMQNMTDTRVAIERWDAQIDNALSTLDTLLSQVVRIKSSEVLSYTGATDDISHSLREEVDSLKATADAVDSVYGWK